MQHLPRFFRRGDLAAELAHDAGGAFNELDIADRQHAVAEINVVFHADPDVATQSQRHGAQRQLVLADADHLPARSVRNGIEHGNQILGVAGIAPLMPSTKLKCSGGFSAPRSTGRCAFWMWLRS